MKNQTSYEQPVCFHDLIGFAVEPVDKFLNLMNDPDASHGHVVDLAMALNANAQRRLDRVVAALEKYSGGPVRFEEKSVHSVCVFDWVVFTSNQNRRPWRRRAHSLTS